MKQTAVEWLKMQLEIRSGIKEITVDSKTFEELCEQAKEMEEKQKGYSEEEVLDLLNNFRVYSYHHGCGSSELLEWFEQFKKK